MYTRQLPKKITCVLIGLAFAAAVPGMATDISTVPLNTYSAASSTDVKPNVLFILDDSGSMDWDFMPDWACASYSIRNSSCDNTGQDPSSPRHEYLFRNSSYNGVYYNPATTYKAPVAVDSSGSFNTTTYPSMTGVSTATGGDGTATSAAPNWKAVFNDAYGVQSALSSKTDLQASTSRRPYFFTTIPGRYCDSASLKVCTLSATATGSYTFPAKVRWCDSSGLSNCRAAFDTGYSWVEAPSPPIATILVDGLVSTSVSSITVDTKEILNATAAASVEPTTLAQNIMNAVNACTITKTGNCQINGYTAEISSIERRDSSNSGSSYGSWYSVSSCTVDNSGTTRNQCRATIQLVAGAATTGTPSITQSGAMTLTPTAFATNGVAGSTVRTVLDPTNNSYPYPGTAAKASTRTDCAGTTCTYNEEMTNYANWWAYYKSRMQTMKSSASNAFSTIDTAADITSNVSRFRLGFMSINNGNGTDFVNLGEFKGTQRYDWYQKLVGANPGNSTPLRSALSKAGRLYAGKYNGLSLNGVNVTDPLQYSCQQNYSILSTDGFWNESSGYYKMDGSNNVGNQDGALAAPYSDGAVAQIQEKTSGLQMRTSQQTAQLGTLQGRTAQVQSSTSNLQERTATLLSSTSTLLTSTSTLLTSTSTLESRTGALQVTPYTLRGTVLRVLMRCNSTSANCGTPPASGLTGVGSGSATWTPTGSSCNNGNSGSSPRCAVVTPTAFARNVGSTCNTGATITGSSNFTPTNTDGGYVYSSCSYVAGATTNGACTYLNPAANPNNTSQLTASICSYAFGAWAGIGSCTWSESTSTVNNTAWTANPARQCRYTAWSAPAALGACTWKNQTTSTASGTAYESAPKQCSYSGWTAPAALGNCTWKNQTTSTANNTAYETAPKQCSYSAWTAAAPAGSCTAVNQSTSTADNAAYQANPVQCSYTGWSGWSNTASCTTVAQSSSGNFNTPARQCQYTAWTAAAPAGSCTALAQSTSSPYSVGTATACSYAAYGAWANEASACTPVAQTTGSNGVYNAVAKQCQYSFAAAAGTPTCSPAYVANNYTNLTVYNNCTTTPGTWASATSCTVNAVPDAQGYTTSCQYTAWSGWSNVASCVAASQSTSPNYTVGTARQCQTLVSGGNSNTLADVAAYYYNTDLRTAVAADGTGTCDGPIIAPATVANDLCANNVPTYGKDQATYQHMTTFTLGLGSQGKMIYAPQDGSDYWNDKSGDFYDVMKATTANTATGICSWQTSGNCAWPTPGSNSNANIDDMWHAAVNGHGTYFSATDPTSLSKSLTSTLSAIKNIPRPGTAAAAASSNPNVSASDNYVFSSSYKSVEWYGELIRQQITETGTLTAQNWSAMKLLDCATTYWTASTSYTAGAVYQYGTAPNAKCYSVNTDYISGASFDSSGADTANTTIVHVDETATTLVNATPLAARTIYTKGTTTLIPFTWSSLVSAGLDSYFKAPNITYVSSASGLSQFCSGGGCLSASLQSNYTIATGGAAGEALVNYLRGDRTYENTYYRKRIHVLGDIVSSEARYVQAPLFTYNDTNYTAFKALQAARTGIVYVGANDGMLHAFNAATGQEAWAYVPGIVLPDIYKLADKDYANNHQFMVDNSPETGDICPKAPSGTCTDSEWKTILVGGLNRGGKGYYALDVTDPASPKLLWEFTHANLGYTYGNPRITKLKDGTWVVLVSSGYNNTADGIGRLFVLNANTGALINTISTGVGTAALPSGISRISAHVLLPMTDNTVVAAYGGDTYGNLWRFDVNNNIGAATSTDDAHLLVTFKDPGGTVQPVTVKPLEATISGRPVVFVGTGRFLGTTDVTDTQTQSFYAVKDNLDSTTLGNPRLAATNFVKQTLTSTTCPADSPITICTPGQTVRLTTANPVDWTSKNGWYMDFLTGGERSSTDPALGLGTLLFTTIAPSSANANACGSDGEGSSFVYALDYLTGKALSTAGGANSSTNTSGVAGISLGTGLVTRPVMIEQSDGTVRALIRSSGGSASSAAGTTDLGGTIVIAPPVNPTSGSGTRRVSWRELTN